MLWFKDADFGEYRTYFYAGYLSEMWVTPAQCEWVHLYNQFKSLCPSRDAVHIQNT